MDKKSQTEFFLSIIIIHFHQKPLLGLRTKGVIKFSTNSSVISSCFLSIEKVSGTGIFLVLRNSLVFNLESAKSFASFELNHFIYFKFLAFCHNRPYVLKNIIKFNYYSNIFLKTQDH